MIAIGLLYVSAWEKGEMAHYQQETAREPDPPLQGGGQLTSVGWLAIGLLTGFLVARQLFLRHDKPAIRRGERQRGDAWEPPSSHPQVVGTRFCPICFGEYLRDTEQCEDCGIDLVDEDSLPDSAPSINESMVAVARVPALSGQLVSQYLIANNVPSILSQNSFWGDILEADIYVFESDALRAKRLLQYYWTQEATSEKRPA